MCHSHGHDTPPPETTMLGEVILVIAILCVLALLMTC